MARLPPRWARPRPPRAIVRRTTSPSSSARGRRRAAAPAPATPSGSSTIASTRASSRPVRIRSAPARAAAQQAQRLDQDALAGAGLAGDRGQARAEGDLHLVDQREPGDLEQRQHGDVIFGANRVRGCRPRLHSAARPTTASPAGCRRSRAATGRCAAAAAARRTSIEAPLASSWPHCPSMVSVTGPSDALRISEARVGPEHQRPVRQRVRADRRQHHRLHVGRQDRPARRQRVRGRAGRRRDDQAVRLVGRDLGAVEARLQVEQARDRSLGQHGVVDGAARRGASTGLARTERIVTARRMRSSTGRRPAAASSTAAAASERAYGVMNPRLPRLTPNSGHAVIGDQRGAVKERAVAAQHREHVDRRAQLARRHDGRAGDRVRVLGQHRHRRAAVDEQRSRGWPRARVPRACRA